MAGSQMQAQQAMIQSDYQDRMKQAMAQQLASEAAGRAAAAMNSQLMGMVGSGYSGAADEVRALGGSLGAAMAGASAADVAAAGATAGNVGAPAPGIGGASPIAGPAQQGVEYFRGAELPAEALGSAGISSQVGLGGLIGAQNLRATQEAQAAYMQALGDANNARTSAIKSLAAGRPDIASKFLLQLQDNQRQAIALASGLIGQIQNVKQAKFTRGMQTKQFQQNVLQQNRQWTQQMWENQFKTNQLSQQDKQFYASLSQKANLAKIQMSQIDPSASRVMGHIVNSMGVPFLKNGKVIPVQSYYGTTRNKGLTPYEQTRLMQKAQDSAEAMFYGYLPDPKTGKRVPASQLGTFDPNDNSTWGKGHLDYGPAMKRLTTMGLTPQGAAQVLNQYYEPGDSGRPIFSTQEVRYIRKSMGTKAYGWALQRIKRLYAAGDPASQREAEQLRNRMLTNPRSIAAIEVAPRLGMGR